jgi:2-polyprenyl-6-methoxyphenol hydroxylase-like FAD-dependent oxidoreductase
MLHELLMSKVPSKRIHFGKTVVSTEQTASGVTIRCEDGTSYNGDILVGADGVNSGVRQRLYSSLKKENKLPLADSEQLDSGYVCLMGTTAPLDPNEYPFVNNKDAVYSHVVGDGSNFSVRIWCLFKQKGSEPGAQHNLSNDTFFVICLLLLVNQWSEFNIGEKRVSWIVVLQQTSLLAAEATRLRNSEWTTNVSDETLDVIKNFRVPGCRTVGDLVVATPDGSICRVFLEDKLFETWYHDRTVLIGDGM